MIGQQCLKGQVRLTDTDSGRVMLVEVSTVDFPNLPGGRSLPPETCLFWNVGQRRRRGVVRNSDVVERYESWEDAAAGHARWLNSPRKVFEAMVAAGWQGE